MTGSYDFEEQERIAELKAWWEDNRWFVLGGVIAALLTFAGYRGWHWWSQQQAEEAMVMYAPVEDATKAGDAKKIEQGAQALIDKHPRSFQASQAALVLAKQDFDASKLDDARKRLEWVMSDGADTLRGVARMRLAAVLLEQKKYDEALKVLEDNKDEAFVPLAADLRGDIMLSQGRLDEARSAYKLAVEKAGPHNPVKGIAETKLNALGGAQ